MEIDIQTKALNDLLAIIYGEGTHLSLLLRELGFEPNQIEPLRGTALENLSGQFLEALHKRLTSESGKDTYYQILKRRLGLDGEPPETLDALAQAHGFTPTYMHQLYDEILERCRTKTTQAELKKNLRQIAVKQLAGLQARPEREHVKEKLVRLTNLHSAADITRLDYEAKRAELFKQIQAELDALEAEYQPLLEAAQDNITALENEVRTEVLLHGQSVEGGVYRAVYTKGRISWDNKGIEHYANTHPEVLKFRKQGDPSVTLRVVGDKS